MKKNDLKSLIKPIVKECIHEVLLEEGLLSNVVAEVAQGLKGNLVVETQTQQSETIVREDLHRKKKTQEVNAKIAAQRKQMMDAIGHDAYNGVNLFEGTEPMAPQSETPGGTVDLGRPGDAGVDISSLMGGASEVWKAMK
jgi:hypothetical protein